MNLKKSSSIRLLFAMFGMNFLNAADWLLLDDFQTFIPNYTYYDAAEIGWNATAPNHTSAYWMLEDPFDAENIAMWVEAYGPGYGTTFLMKALPGGGIPPGEKGTLFFRCLWAGYSNDWQMGTFDKPLEIDEETGQQTSPGAWGDLNALIRMGPHNVLQHRDGNSYVATNPSRVVQFDEWYSFWMVVDNSWDMTTSPPTCTGTHTLYVQGEGFGNGLGPTLIPVGTNPAKESASIRRAPVDVDGNPRAIIWAVFATTTPIGHQNYDMFLLDDFYFTPGENLTHPIFGVLPGQLEFPSDLEAVFLSDSEIEFTWQDNASTETGFRISMKIGEEGTWEELADIPEANVTSFRMEGLDPNQPMRFRLQVYGDGLESGYSNVATPTWENPVLQGAVFQDSGWWHLDWLGDYAELDRDWIYHDELDLLYVQGEDANSAYMYSALLESWLWTSGDLFPWFYKYGPYAGWYYYYTGSTRGNQWFARYSDGTFVRASQINQAVPPPDAPSNLVANITSPNSVYLTWEDNADDEVGYRIFMMAGEDGIWIEVATLPSKNLTHHYHEGTDTGVPLQFRIQAYTYGNESEFSNVALAEANSAGPGSWLLIDDFQAHNSNEIFFDATEIGWYACSPTQMDEYWMLQDPLDPGNIAMYVDSQNDGVNYSNTWVMKALPSGGIQPGQTGTLFFRSYWFGIDDIWHMATADKPLAYDDVTGLQISPGAWGDLNALIRIGSSGALEHRDGGGYVTTNPQRIPQVNTWYSFWMVVDNSWDMRTSPPKCTGTHTLYVQGAGFGDGVTPTLIPVGSGSSKVSASLRRAPADDDGNPRVIIWAVFAASSGPPGSGGGGDVFLLDDFYFSEGVNLTRP